MVCLAIPILLIEFLFQFCYCYKGNFFNVILKSFINEKCTMNKTKKQQKQHHKESNNAAMKSNFKYQEPEKYSKAAE